MPVIFRRVNPVVSVEENLRNIKSNFDKVETAINRTYINLLASVISRTSSSTTSSTYSSIPNFSVGFTVSGKLVEIQASISVRVDNVATATGQVAMFIDNAETAAKSSQMFGSAGRDILPFVYKTTGLAPGRHRVEFKYKSSGGSLLTVNGSDGGFESQTSELFVTEYSVP